MQIVTTKYDSFVGLYVPYLSEILTKVQGQEKLEEIMAVGWHHMNMIGEYKFGKLLNNNYLRFNL